MLSKVRRAVGQFILAAAMLPWWAVSWAFVVVGVLLRYTRRVRVEEPLLLVGEWAPWVARRWRYSNAFGRAMLFRSASSRTDRTVRAHEAVHVRQQEDLSLALLALAAAQLALGAPWYVALLTWSWTGASHLVAYAAAWLRTGRAYLDAEHERAAYAQTDPIPGGVEGLSWLDLWTAGSNTSTTTDEDESGEG